ncbi:unnamed protein product [Timema podura]|uniref:BLOC-1-related complex subunit 7 n=1 Tax=Timema podura TaxID=61482 RepID=A0ABN7NJU6_TIMPD|nr:unnamed protein product [Timema podura]
MLIQTSSADEPMVIFYKCCTDGCSGQNKDSTVTEVMMKWYQRRSTEYSKEGRIGVPYRRTFFPTIRQGFRKKKKGEVHYICDCGVPGSIIKKRKCLSIMIPVQLNNMVPVKRAKLNYVANLIAKHFGANWREREDLAYYSKILMHAARNFALQEHAINNSESNLKKLQLISAHLGYQQESLMKSSLLVEEVKEQVRAMQR